VRVDNKTVVVTGAASGIGVALAHRFHAEGAKLIVCSDINGDGARVTAEAVGGIAFTTDVSKEADIQYLVEHTWENHGPIDLFCSNAGIGVGGGAEASDDGWTRSWNVNVMAHVWAARHVVPRMIDNGGGYLLNTASAAGLLSQIGSAPYAVTKHAAVVSVLCPQAVRTAMTANNPDGVASVDGMMEPEVLAESVVRGLEAEDFLILPHAEVLQYMRNKTGDYNRWIGGMKKLQRRYRG
jgi:short-subunit dehydrogenase